MVDNTHPLRTVDPIPDVDLVGIAADCIHPQEELVLGTGFFLLTVTIPSIWQDAPAVRMRSAISASSCTEGLIAPVWSVHLANKAAPGEDSELALFVENSLLGREQHSLPVVSATRQDTKLPILPEQTQRFAHQLGARRDQQLHRIKSAAGLSLCPAQIS